jgi:MFS family permease
MARTTLIDPLRRRVFRHLVATYAVNEFGDWMGVIALSVLVYDRTQSALATTALFLATGFVPAIAAPFVVTRVEQPPPRFVLPVLYCGEAAAFGALAVFAKHFSLGPVLALAAIDGSLAIASRSLTRAVVVSVLEPFGELRAGNAILNVAFTGGAAAGPALAGLVVAGFSVETALWIDAISFYATAWILLSAGPLPRAEPEPGRMRDRLRAGAAYIRERAALRRLLLVQAAAFVFFAAVIPVEVVYAKKTLGTTDSGYGLMLTSWGVGMLAGSGIFAAARGMSLRYLLFISTMAVGVGYLGLAAAPSLALACVASAVGGAGNGVQWVAVISAVQELTSEGMQARVISVLESVGTAMPGVGFLLGGIVAAVATPRTTFLVAGLGVFAILSIAVPFLGRAWRDSPAEGDSQSLDEGNAVVLELLPGGRAASRGPQGKSNREVKN